MSEVLTYKDLVLGAKYVPIGKTIGSTMSNSKALKRAREKNQLYLIYNGVSNSHHVFADTFERNSGDYFAPSDVVPYQEEEQYDVF